MNNPRTRRYFTHAQKKAILDEANSLGNVTAVAHKHNIAPALLFAWKKDFRVLLAGQRSRGELTDPAVDQEIAACKSTIANIEQLEGMQQAAFEATNRELQTQAISSYKASIAVASLVNSEAKLAEMKVLAFERLKNLQRMADLHREKQNEPQLSVQDKRAVEMLVVEIAKREVARKESGVISNHHSLQ